MAIDLSALLCCGNGGKWEHYVQFTSDGTWTKPADVNVIRVIAIGGGGGGGAPYVGVTGSYPDWDLFRVSPGGGGGAGQYIDQIIPVTGDINIHIGQGGIGGGQDLDGTNPREGNHGESTTLSGGVTLEAYGGGGGAGGSYNASQATHPYPINGLGCVGGSTGIPDTNPSTVQEEYIGGSGGGIGEKYSLRVGVPGYPTGTFDMRGLLPPVPDATKPIMGNYGDFHSSTGAPHISYVYPSAPRGIHGIGGGGSGSNGTVTLINLGGGSYDLRYDRFIHVSDGAGRGGVFCTWDGNQDATETLIDQNEVNGTPGEPNTGAGGGAGGLAVWGDGFYNEPFPRFGSGGQGGSGTVIIMW